MQPSLCFAQPVPAGALHTARRLGAAASPLSTGRLRARPPSTPRRARAARLGVASAADSPDASATAAAAAAAVSDGVHAGKSCGFAALVGPSNSGKSTLLNRLVGQKLAIVTPKVQTTRCRIAGIVTSDAVMTIYLDTPGIFKANGRLDRAMVRAAWSSARGADVVAVIVDGAQLYHRGRRQNSDESPIFINEALEEVFRRCPSDKVEFCVCMNKIDTIPDEHVDQFLRHFSDFLARMEIADSTRVFPISALTGQGMEAFVSWVHSRMPAGPWLYPEDDLTDMPMRLIASEVTREKVFLLLRHEIPYEVAIETTSFKEKSDGSVRILQDVIVGRNSHKGMVTGKGGAMVKAIGTAARKDLSEMMDCVVHLMLTVKVREKWKEEASSYRAWGLDYDA